MLSDIFVKKSSFLSGSCPVQESCVPGLRMGQAFDSLLEMVPQSVMNYCNYNTRETLESVHCDPSVRNSRIIFLLKLFKI